MFIAGTPTQEQDIVKPNCAQNTVWCFIKRLLLVKQVLNLRFFQFRWFVGILSLRSKLRKTCMYERESGTYSPTFCFRNTSAGSTYRFLPFVKHIQVTLHLFSLRFFFSVFYNEIFDDFDFQGLFTWRWETSGKWGNPRLGGMPGLLGRVALSVGVTI